jgi:hypothetical protein
MMVAIRSTVELGLVGGDCEVDHVGGGHRPSACSLPVAVPDAPLNEGKVMPGPEP